MAINLKKLNSLKTKINKLDNESMRLNMELKQEILIPFWNEVDVLQELVKELPDGFAKYSTYQRIETLKKIHELKQDIGI